MASGQIHTSARFQISVKSLLLTFLCLMAGLSATIKPGDLAPVDRFSNPLSWLDLFWQIALSAIACGWFGVFFGNYECCAN